MCGGTQNKSVVRVIVVGLSPRVRGNQTDCAFQIIATRSIPACAGEPLTISLSCPMRSVYPRVCGEPVTLSTIFPLLWVYPRVCGGTEVVFPLSRLPEGLSPRVRGNRGAFSGRIGI